MNISMAALIELIAKFEPFMAVKLATYGNKGRGVPDYLSSTIFKLMIQWKGENKINEEAQQTKYYYIIFLADYLKMVKGICQN